VIRYATSITASGRLKEHILMISVEIHEGRRAPRIGRCYDSTLTDPGEDRDIRLVSARMVRGGRSRELWESMLSKLAADVSLLWEIEAALRWRKP